MELLTYLGGVHKSIEQAHAQLDSHCRSIHQALRNISKRIELEERLLKEAQEAAAAPPITESQLDEIDALIKKAENVLVEDFDKRPKKNRPKFAAAAAATTSAPAEEKKKMGQKQLTVKSKNNTVSKVGVNKPKLTKGDSKPSKGKLKGKRSDNLVSEVTNNLRKRKDDNREQGTIEQVFEKESTKPESTKDESSTLNKTEKLPLFDDTFKEVYCSFRKQKKNMAKLLNDDKLRETNRRSKAEFTSAISATSTNKGNDILDGDLMEMLPSLGLTKLDISGALEKVEHIRKLTAAILGNQNQSLNSYSLYNISNCRSIEELKNRVRLVEYRHDVLFQEKLMFFVKHLSSEGGMSGNTQCYRRLYMLLLNSTAFPCLIEN